MTRFDFRSDNVAGVAPRILEALTACNHDSAGSYGADPWSAALAKRFNEIFEREVSVFPVATGTAANALGLAQIVPSWGTTYCHRLAHIELDECGAPEFFTGGAKLALLDGSDGKIAPETFAQALGAAPIGVQHHPQPAALSLSQASECGTVYRPNEIQALSDLAKRKNLLVQMDGARLANALAYLDCAPADVTWRAGIDVLAFGATKNGAMVAEAVVIFDPERAGNFLYRRKRGGHLWSKMRFLSAQLLAYLEGGRWLIDAAHANEQARRLGAGLCACPGVTLLYPIEANEVFVRLPRLLVARLQAIGALFHPWSASGTDAYRFVTAWSTDPRDIDDFVRLANASL